MNRRRETSGEKSQENKVTLINNGVNYARICR